MGPDHQETECLTASQLPDIDEEMRIEGFKFDLSLGGAGIVGAIALRQAIGERIRKSFMWSSSGIGADGAMALAIRLNKWAGSDFVAEELIEKKINYGHD